MCRGVEVCRALSSSVEFCRAVELSSSCRAVELSVKLSSFAYYKGYSQLGVISIGFTGHSFSLSHFLSFIASVTVFLSAAGSLKVRFLSG